MIWRTDLFLFDPFWLNRIEKRSFCFSQQYGKHNIVRRRWIYWNGKSIFFWIVVTSQVSTVSTSRREWFAEAIIVSTPRSFGHSASAFIKSSCGENNKQRVEQFIEKLFQKGGEEISKQFRFAKSKIKTQGSNSCISGHDIWMVATAVELLGRRIFKLNINKKNF